MSRAALSRLTDDAVPVTLVAWRLLNSVTLRTFFQPDEYYQLLEPAWGFAPNHSGEWITWEWTQHLRSAIHPAIFGCVYYLTQLISTRLLSPELCDSILIYAPKTVQAVIAALGDYYTWKLSQKLYGKPDLATSTLFLSIWSPWQWFCSTRTFSNGFENTLTVIALYHWPYFQKVSDSQPTSGANDAEKVGSKTLETAAKDLRMSLVLAATASILRPTNLLIWIVLACAALSGSEEQPPKPGTKAAGLKPTFNSTFGSRLKLLLREGILSGGVAFLLSAIIDRTFYGVWTLPALNFLYFNVVQSLAVFYGNNDWHYYLSQGYPLLLTTALPFALVGLFKVFTNSPSVMQLHPATRNSLKQLAVISVVLPAALSVLSHKEVRFIYPIIGPLHIIAAAPLSDFFGPVSQRSSQQPQSTTTRSILTRRVSITIIISLNILIAGYTSLIHNSGIIALPEYIRSEFHTHYNIPPSASSVSASTSPSTNPNLTLAILMPCHSLPWRSHLLNPATASQPGIQAWALTCEPPLHLTSPTDKQNYLDEADIFYANPTLWLRKNMSRRPPHAPSEATANIHTNPHPNHAVNKFLHVKPTAPSPDIFTHRPGLDITDLLPYLRTAPGTPPAMDSLSEPLRRPWPHYIAFFAQLEPIMVRTLRGSGYVECWRVFNSHWHDDWRRTGDIVVWCLFPERARGGRGGDVEMDADVLEERRAGELLNNRRGKDVAKPSEERVVPARSGTQTVVRA